MNDDLKIVCRSVVLAKLLPHGEFSELNLWRADRGFYVTTQGLW